MNTRNLLIIALVIAVLAAYGIIGMNYLNQRNQNDAYTAQIADASAELLQIPQPPTDLEQQLTAAQDSLNEAQNAFVFTASDTEIIDTILAAAAEIDIIAVPLSTQPWVQEIVSNQTYSVFRIVIQITATYQQVAAFIDQLENGQPETLIIESLTVIGPSGASLLESSDRDALPITANIQIAIYASLAEQE
jgi:ABC-type sugar transport system substrate-binding protein